MKYAIFGDESTLPRILSMLGDAASIVVVAGNRPQAAAAMRGRAIVQPSRESPDYRAFLSAVTTCDCDAILCCSYSMILRKDLLSVPPLGAINLHGGLLPRYRGANVLNWVLVEGAAATGVTAHYMSEKVDEGDIIYQEPVVIADDDTAVTLKSRLDETAFRLIERIHAELSAGRVLPRRPQDPGEARYYRRRTPEDGRIDWSRSDREIFNLVRAVVKPWPGAYFTTRDGSRRVIDHYLTLEEVAELRRIHGC